MQRMIKQAMPLGLLMAALLGCTASPTTDTAVMPVEQEPHHKIVYENDLLRVYDVNLQPGEETAYHEHRNDLLTVVVAASKVANQTLGQAESIDQAPSGMLIYSPYSTQGPFRHRVLATQGQPFHVLGIGLKGDNQGASKVLLGRPDEPLFRFPQGQVQRLTLEPGAAVSLTRGLIVTLDAGQLNDANMLAGRVWGQAGGLLRNHGDTSMRLLQIRLD